MKKNVRKNVIFLLGTEWLSERTPNLFTGFLTSVSFFILVFFFIIQPCLADTPITPEVIAYYENSVSPRVIALMKCFNTFEELQQFAKDRRAVANLLPIWKRDKIMHKLWFTELQTPNQYKRILKGRE